MAMLGLTLRHVGDARRWHFSRVQSTLFICLPDHSVEVGSVS